MPTPVPPLSRVKPIELQPPYLPAFKGPSAEFPDKQTKAAENDAKKVVALPDIPFLLPPDFSDSALDRSLFEMLSELRESQNETCRINYSDVGKKQGLQKEKQEQLNELQKYLEEKAKTAEALEWVHVGTTVTTVICSVICFALGLVTGGIGAIPGAISAVAGAMSGTTSVANSALQLQKQEKQGLTLELRETRSLDQHMIQEILGNNQHVMEKVALLWSLSMMIIRKQLQVKNQLASQS